MGHRSRNMEPLTKEDLPKKWWYRLLQVSWLTIAIILLAIHIGVVAMMYAELSPTKYTIYCPRTGATEDAYSVGVYNDPPSPIFYNSPGEYPPSLTLFCPYLTNEELDELATTVLEMRDNGYSDSYVQQYVRDFKDTWGIRFTYQEVTNEERDNIVLIAFGTYAGCLLVLYLVRKTFVYVATGEKK